MLVHFIILLFSDTLSVSLETTFVWRLFANRKLTVACGQICFPMHC